LEFADSNCLLRPAAKKPRLFAVFLYLSKVTLNQNPMAWLAVIVTHPLPQTDDLHELALAVPRLISS
ncbi:hypothetical protein OFD71_35390, partial [Escherichia coli]|nr:hypothetical protein [Escherichia coli]